MAALFYKDKIVGASSNDANNIKYGDSTVGEVLFDKNRIVVVSFTYPNAGETINIPYPEGFNRDNCVILAQDFFMYYRWYQMPDTALIHLHSASMDVALPSDAGTAGVPGRIVLLKIS